MSEAVRIFGGAGFGSGDGKVMGGGKVVVVSGKVVTVCSNSTPSSRGPTSGSILGGGGVSGAARAELSLSFMYLQMCVCFVVYLVQHDLAPECILLPEETIVKLGTEFHPLHRAVDAFVARPRD